MNSLERIVSATRFQAVDRTPVVAQVFGHAAALAGVPLDDYIRDGQTLADCQLRALRRYGYDAVFTVMDVNVETEAAGSRLRYRANQYSVIEQYALSSDNDWNKLSLPDPLKAGRMPQMLKALAILRRQLGDEVLIVGCIMGPFTLAVQLLGLEKALYLAIDDSPRLERLLDFATEALIRFGQAQVKAGAHLPVIFDPCASPAVVPPGFFREFELPRLGRICQALKAAGALANWLHIAGPVQPIFPYYPQAGVNLACFDYVVSPAEVRGALPTTCLAGNLRPVAFVDGAPAEIEAEARNLLRFFADNRGYILSSGCEIPPESKPENIAALVNAARVQE
jgi:uroporphyrinogen decarboxylase